MRKPKCALYSNTPYTASVDYSYGSSHGLSFNSDIGGTGYLTSESWTKGITWGINGMATKQCGKKYYAVGWYCNDVYGNHYLAKTGLTQEYDPTELFHDYVVLEYLQPDLSQENCGLPTTYAAKTFGVSGNAHAHFLYQETSSLTWQEGVSGSVGINFLCFSISVNIEVTATVTSGHTNTIIFTVGPLPPAELEHTFVLYTKGFSFTEPNGKDEDTANRGGIELHIWDMGVT